MSDSHRYMIKRFYQRRDSNPRTVARGLTLAEAQRHCQDPQSSSATCTNSRGRRRTRAHGPWFDGYDVDHGRRVR